MTDHVRIDICCNDPDNGTFAGRANQIHLPDGLLELSARNWNLVSDRGCPKFRDEGDAIVLSGKCWPIVHSKDYYGNWCWNAYWMRDQVARQFLVWLHRRKLFVCDQGEARLFALWKREAPLDLEPDNPNPRGLGRLLGKAMLAEQRAAR